MVGTMDWFEAYQGLTGTEKEQFSRIVNRLLASTYLVKRKEDNRRDYFFTQRHENLFRGYLRLGGWLLASDPALGVYSLESPHNRLHLRMEESIIILIVRLLYEEKRGEVSLAEDVSIRVGEIQERYSILAIKKRPIDKATLRETIGLLKRFNILTSLTGDVTDPECRLVVYPSILIAIRVDDIKEVHERLEGYTGNAETECDEEGGS